MVGSSRLEFDSRCENQILVTKSGIDESPVKQARTWNPLILRRYHNEYRFEGQLFVRAGALSGFDSFVLNP